MGHNFESICCLGCNDVLNYVYNDKMCAEIRKSQVLEARLCYRIAIFNLNIRNILELLVPILRVFL